MWGGGVGVGDGGGDGAGKEYRTAESHKVPKAPGMELNHEV